MTRTASFNNAGGILTGHYISHPSEPTFSMSRAKRLCNYCRICIYLTHVAYNLPLPLIDYYLPHSFSKHHSRRSKMPQKANQSLSKPQERHPAGSHRPSQAKSSHRQRHHSAPLPPSLHPPSSLLTSDTDPNQTLPPSQAFHSPSYSSLSPPQSDLVQPTPHITGNQQTSYTPLPTLLFFSSKQTNKQVSNASTVCTTDLY